MLLVEDDIAMSALVSALIEEAGYQPITITDHRQIASAVERWDPRCVILDGAVAPTGQGRSWDDAIAIRRAHPTLPVLMFSGDAAAVAEVNAGVSARSRAAGFVAGVDKPFVIEEFLSVLRHAMPDRVSVEAAPPEAAPARGAFTVFPDITGSLEDGRRRDFVSAAAHELRLPLTVIRGQIQLARRHAATDAERGDRALDVALGQVDRMSRMIDAVIEHAKLASNSLTLEVTAFDLVLLVNEAVARHQHEEPPRITLTVAAGLRAVILADRDCVAQIIDNLLDNALKY
ncbi:MAG TPA: histidine kinase dimerization/phospho-acceptor domain-containing protein, partial [Candidatus Limnocylindrales bacterium]|nr:histidine kinase dimerization/phospho-acceptor domain-containing protein [Candidatus Limnocylindrales bacterium]